MATAGEKIDLRVMLGRLVAQAMDDGRRYHEEGRVLEIEWAHRRDRLIENHADEILGYLDRGCLEERLRELYGPEKYPDG